MTAPYRVAVYSMYVAVCSNSAVADIIIIVIAAPLIYPLCMQQSEIKMQKPDKE